MLQSKSNLKQNSQTIQNFRPVGEKAFTFETLPFSLYLKDHLTDFVHYYNYN